MFGYIKPCSAHLSDENQALFRSYYCGLCRSLGSEYGLHARAFLNYECVFLSLLMDALQEPTASVPGHCFIPPFKSKAFSECEASQYAAAINILLAYYKIEDNWMDEHSPGAWIGLRIYQKSFTRATDRYPEAARDLKYFMEEFNAVEDQKPAGPSELAHLCGKLLQTVFEHGAGPSPYRDALGWAGYHIGRWVYLLDAFDDMIEDHRSNKYNPFLLASPQLSDKSPSPITIKSHDLVEYRQKLLPWLDRQLNSSLDEVAKSLLLIKPPRHAAILDNLVHHGMRRQTYGILHEHRSAGKQSRWFRTHPA